MATAQKGVGTASPDASGVNIPDYTKEKVWIFELCQKVHSTSKLIIDGKETNDTGSPYQPYLSIKNPILVYDQKTKKQRLARLIEGVPSIFDDEQEKIPQPMKDQAWIPVFKDGFMFLRTPQDATKVEFLMNHDQFEGNLVRVSQKPPKFKLASKESQSVDDYDFLEKKQKAFTLAIEAPKEVMMAHAKYLNVAFKDVHGQDLVEKSIRVAYIRKAENDPILFMKSYDNPLTNAAFFVSEAVANGRITLSHVKGQAHWEDTKALILVLDADEKPVDQLAKYSLTPKGSDFYNRVAKNN